ncbi:aminoglycoside phosphotransferase family protein [Candidatus Bathyarchaeota archaeon]|jgi:aminoglycoside 2''-phosphotransferase|nr:aminoglycoside phosphotransferase family protein [Candidatus Bathyarchaeota archaeon]
MVHSHVIRDILARDLSELTVERVEFEGQGWNHRVYRVNRDFIFKFPKDKDAESDLAAEIRILAQISSALNIPVPQYMFVVEDSASYEYLYGGHRAIEGIPLTRDVLLSLQPHSRHEIAEQLAIFLSTLHGCQPVEELEGLIPVEDFRRGYTSLLGDVRTYIFPKISNDGCKILEYMFTSYLENSSNFASELALLHGDLSAEHVFICLETQRLSGVIDFGNVCFGDPDYDFWHLNDDYGEDYLHRIRSHYDSHKNTRTGTEFREKLMFFQIADTIDGILNYAYYMTKDELDGTWSRLKGFLKHERDQDHNR